jgi:2-polyprenyl-3-methyl-5-hydroxy-6-metoxy-1,4-benzoquinol methylase
MMDRSSLTPRACPVCSSTDESNVFAEERLDFSRLDAFAFASRKVPEYMHFRLLRCPTCDLLYSNPILPLHSIDSAYEEAAFDSAGEAACAARTYGQLLSTFLTKLPDRVGALDIGTGDGAFLGELLQKGFSEVVGVEPSRMPVESSRPEIRPHIRLGVFNASDFNPESLSLVTCFQTLEHVSEPLEICRSIFRLLKKGGAFFAVSHNCSSFSARVLGTKSPIIDIEHLQILSPKSARFLMEKAGFSRIEIKPIINRYPLHFWTKLFPLPKSVKMPLIAGLKATGIGYLPIPLPAGNISIVGYK